MFAILAAAAVLVGPPAPTDILPPDPTLAEEARVRRSGDEWEAAYQVLNLVDVAQTCDFLHRGVAYEANPVFGRRPRCSTVVAAKGAFGLAHWLLYRHLRQRNPRFGRMVAQVSAVVQGSVVAANVRFLF